MLVPTSHQAGRCPPFDPTLPDGRVVLPHPAESRTPTLPGVRNCSPGQARCLAGGGPARCPGSLPDMRWLSEVGKAHEDLQGRLTTGKLLPLPC